MSFAVHAVFFLPPQVRKIAVSSIFRHRAPFSILCSQFTNKYRGHHRVSSLEQDIPIEGLSRGYVSDLALALETRQKPTYTSSRSCITPCGLTHFLVGLPFFLEFSQFPGVYFPYMHSPVRVFSGLFLFCSTHSHTQRDSPDWPAVLTSNSMSILSRHRPFP